VAKSTQMSSRFWWQLGHRHRWRQLKATAKLRRHSLQYKRAKPCSRIPQSKNLKTDFCTTFRRKPKADSKRSS
jgi:hypothetical protein